MKHQNREKIVPLGWDLETWEKLPPQDKAYFLETPEQRMNRRVHEILEIGIKIGACKNKN